MIKKLKLKIKEEGIVNVGIMVTACLAVIGSLISVIYANASGRISTLEVKSDTYSIDIATLKANTSDIPNMKEKLDAVYSGLLNKGFIYKVK